MKATIDYFFLLLLDNDMHGDKITHMASSIMKKHA